MPLHVPQHTSRFAGRVLAGALMLVGCATARPAAPPTRLVANVDWGDVVDCVMLSARASEYYAELDLSGISITPGVTPLVQERGVSRTSVVGTVRIEKFAQRDGLRITTVARNWDPSAARHRTARLASAALAVARQLDAQCLSTYTVIATE